MASSIQVTCHRLDVAAVDDYCSSLGTALRSNPALTDSSSVEQWFLLTHANPRIRTRTTGDSVEVHYTHLGEDRLIMTIHCPRPNA